MHTLFVHPSYPGQFGHVARSLVREWGDTCTFVCEESHRDDGEVRRIAYRPAGPARPTGYLIQDFESSLSHATGVFDALKPLQRKLKPDLIVGHANWGSTLFLPEVFPDVPIIDYFEYYHQPHGSAIDFRPDFPPAERAILRHRVQNAHLLLQLESCDAGYSPTDFQARLLPDRYRSKIRVIHDGIDTSVWRRSMDPVGPPGETRIVTYVARGFEAMRGFDIFMHVAKRIYELYPNVVFLVVGSDSVEYGSDLEHIEEKSLKEHVLAQGDYDLDRIRFLGWLSQDSLVRVLSLSDVHIYLTAPFVLSWSLLNAMACGCTVLASDTEPVREVIRDGENGLLRGFFDEEGLAETAVAVLKEPQDYRHLGKAAERTIRDRYSTDVVLPRMRSFYAEVASGALSP
jgi:glycosyltransferase involved in cell wall biosynthesis